MKICDECKRVIDMASIEVSYIDEMTGQYVLNNTYCSVDCVVKGVE